VLSALPVAAHTEVTPGEVEEMIASDQELIILDVREYSEFCGSAEHIEDAANLPWMSGVLEARHAVLPSDGTIVVVCASGGRSHLAANYLDTQGFTDVYDMLGGMSGWTSTREPCDPAPVLHLSKRSLDVEINWTPSDGTQDYDLVQGFVENLSITASTVDLGPTDCLANASPFTYHGDSEPAPQASTRFYLSRQTGGSWGESSQGHERIAGPPGCE
jgi:rhodanese-related sulfurtransferase